MALLNRIKNSNSISSNYLFIIGLCHCTELDADPDGTPSLHSDDQWLSAAAVTST